MQRNVWRISSRYTNGENGTEKRGHGSLFIKLLLLMNTINDNKPLSFINQTMDLFETIKDLQEANQLLVMVQNEPQKVCDEYWIDMDDIYAVEMELTDRINALEDKDIKGFCESKLKQVNYSNSRIEWIKSEIARLQALLETEEKHLDKAKNSIDWIMKATGTDKLETSLNNLSYRKSESVSILDENSIPAEYWKEKVTKSIDKVGIKEAIKSWKEVAWASIQTNMNLQIK